MIKKIGAFLGCGLNSTPRGQGTAVKRCSP
jgi:hypothetical protein